VCQGVYFMPAGRFLLHSLQFEQKTNIFETKKKVLLPGNSLSLQKK
jgi:hypothetical protein